MSSSPEIRNDYIDYISVSVSSQKPKPKAHIAKLLNKYSIDFNWFLLKFRYLHILIQKHHESSYNISLCLLPGISPRNTGTNALPAASAGDSGTLPKAPGPPFIPSLVRTFTPTAGIEGIDVFQYIWIIIILNSCNRFEYVWNEDWNWFQLEGDAFS